MRTIFIAGFILSAGLQMAAQMVSTVDTYSSESWLGANQSSTAISPLRSMATAKSWTAVGIRYDQLAPDLSFIGYGDDDGTDLILYLGTGKSATNAVTNIRLYTAATYGGAAVLQGQLTSGGTLELGTGLNTTSGQTRVFRGAPKVGTDLAGLTLRLDPGNPTGNADGGSLEVYTTRDGGTTGTSQRASIKSFQVDKNGIAGAFPGTAGKILSFGGSLTATTTDVGNSAGAETDLASYTIPGTVVQNTGDVVQLHAWGTLNNNADTKRVIVYFDGYAIADTTELAMNDGSWEITAEVARISSTRGIAKVRWDSGNAVLPHYVFPILGTTNTWANDIIFKITGNGAATNDVVLKYAGWGIRLR